jgi:hypothetical protein
MAKERWIHEYMQIDQEDNLYYYKEWAYTDGASTVPLEQIEKKLVSSAGQKPEIYFKVEDGTLRVVGPFTAPTDEMEVLAAKLSLAANVQNWTLPYWRNIAQFVVDSMPFNSKEEMARALCTREGNDPDRAYNNRPLWHSWVKYANAFRDDWPA